MGCTASRLDNEDTVRRCKERRRLMKEAVDSRHHLASAHSEYLNSLRLTGSALTRFAQGEPLAVSDHTPPILLLRTYPIPPPSTATSLPPPTPQPPPPPPRLFSSSPPSPTIASSKLPHILSDSTPVSTPSSFRKPAPAPAPAPVPAKYYPHIPMNSTYATTPSQSSSAWDWENFYPPSPPDSEFFDRLRTEREEMKRQQHHLPREEVDEEEGGIHGEREEIHCRDWDERYSGTTSSTTECDGENEEEEERESRSDRIAARSDYGGSDPSRVAPSEIGSSAAAEVKTARRERSEAGSSSAGWNGREDASSAAELKMVVRHRNLVEIVAALQEYFVKVADAGEGVSGLLETGRAQFERSFRQLKSE